MRQNIENTEIELTDVMTGGKDKRMYLYYQLKSSLEKANSVDIVVSFLMESGVKMPLSELESALTSGIEWNYRFRSTTDQTNYDKFFYYI